MSLFLQARNFELIKTELEEVHLSNIELKSNADSFVSEKTKGAKDGKEETANGDELFVRLSAFEEDIRIDKKNKCLLPGSYTTTASDALRCKTEGNNPNERYALPNELPIKCAFFIQPITNDILQRGIVQEALGKKGGGRKMNAIQLPDKWINFLINLPETGMGYQLVRVILKNGKVLRNHKVLNGSLLLLEKNEHLAKDDIVMVEAER